MIKIILPYINIVHEAHSQTLSLVFLQPILSVRQLVCISPLLYKEKGDTRSLSTELTKHATLLSVDTQFP